MARTLKGVVSAAALEGFSVHISQYEGGMFWTLQQSGVPILSGDSQWGEESLMFDRIEAHVTKYRLRREDDPAFQHEGVYE